MELDFGSFDHIKIKTLTLLNHLTNLFPPLICFLFL
jgi:hypothetical protein